MTTSKRPVTHPATQDIQRHLDQGWRRAKDGIYDEHCPDGCLCKWCQSQKMPNPSTSTPSAAPQASGVSQCPDAADGRTAAVDEVTMIADVVARLTPCTCSAQRERAEKAEAEVARLEAGGIADVMAERDDLLAMKARVEALADKWQKYHDYVTTRDRPSPRMYWHVAANEVRDAIRGERCSTCGGGMDSPPCCKSPDGSKSGHTITGGCESR